MLRIFEAIIDDGSAVYKVHKACRSQKEMKEYCQGNGEIVRVKDVTGDFGIQTDSGVDRLVCTLECGGYGQMEIDIITRLVRDISLK